MATRKARELVPMVFKVLWIRNRPHPFWVETKLYTLSEHSPPRPGIPLMEGRAHSKHSFESWGNLEVSRPIRWTAPSLRRSSTLVEQIGRELEIQKTLTSKVRAEAGHIIRASSADYLSIGTCIRLASDARTLVEARRLHTRIVGAGLESNSDVGSALINMFINCGSLAEAHDVFDKLPYQSEKCWTGLISGYVKQGRNKDALLLYEEMLQAGVDPTPFTFSVILKACGGLKDLELGRQVHRDVIRTGCELDPFVGPSLVTMYAKSGSVRDAEQVFNDSPQSNVFLWNTMIAAYAQNGYGVDALKLFERMEEVGMSPNKHTYVQVFRACGSIGAIGEGKRIHDDIRSTGLQFDQLVGSALVEMYAEYGQLGDAKLVFEEMPAPTVGAWNTMIRAYGQNDRHQISLQCFHDMQRKGVRPDGHTFTALFVACSHQGLVTEAQQFFRLMQEDYGIIPTRQHYTCLADVLGRSGHLSEAENILDTMPFVPTVAGWTSLLSACSRLGEVDIGRRCFDRILETEPNTASSYLLMSRLYESVGMTEEAERIENLRLKAGARNYPASVLIQSSGGVHEFLSGGASKTHPLYKVLQERVRSITENMRLQGFEVEGSGGNPARKAGPSSPDVASDKQAVTDYNKAMSAKGSVGTIVGRKRHSNNRLRMCGSCHQWVKALSVTEKQAVIVRDGYRTHHFKDGECSCGSHDYADSKITFCGHSERLAIVFGMLSRADQNPDKTST